MTDEDNPLTPDWWPEAMRSWALSDPMDVEHVLVGRCASPWGDFSNFHVTTALASDTELSAVRNNNGNVEAVVVTNGPHPASQNGTFVPRFSVPIRDESVALEPLILQWQMSQWIAQQIDPGFLMTFGLVPTNQADNEQRWDDPERPWNGIAHIQGHSHYSGGNFSDSSVSIHRDFLQEYATLRGSSLVQAYFLGQWVPIDENLETWFRSFGNDHTFSFDDRTVRIYRNDERALIEVRGMRLLCQPGSSPVSERRDDYGELDWPGLGVVNEDSVRRGHQFAYVADDVLTQYIEQPGFRFFPESGGVSYYGQWSNGNTQRVGRDTIQVDLKKLYEGTNAYIVRDWHNHAIPRPAGSIQSLVDTPNIGSRVRASINALRSFDRAIVDLSYAVPSANPRGVDTFLKGELPEFSKGEFDWYLASRAQKLACPLAANAAPSEALRRCKELYAFGFERMDERALRDVASAIGFERSSISDLGPLRLLALVHAAATTAVDTGLSLRDDGPNVVQRTYAKTEDGATVRTDECGSLTALYELRNADSHEFEAGSWPLETLGLTKIDLLQGGLAFDQRIDCVTKQIIRITTAISDACPT